MTARAPVTLALLGLAALAALAVPCGSATAPTATPQPAALQPAPPPPAPEEPPPEFALPSLEDDLLPLQESILLQRVVSAFPPGDGLLRVGLGVDLFGVERLRPRGRETVSHRDAFLEAEYSPLRTLHAVVRLPYRKWSGGTGSFPPAGSGLGDLDGLVAVALPRPLPGLGLVAAAGAALPTGEEGLSEGKVSPRVLLASGLRFWRDGPYPTLTLHLNAGRRWNAAERGYGATDAPYQPWPPLYPAAPQAADNDALLLGGAVELSRGTTRLFLAYDETRLADSDSVSGREHERFLTAGLTWGRREGPGVRLAYAVSLARDDPATPFVPVVPDLVTSVSLSWQFGAGGRDRDDDGVPDRRDDCVAAPEDRDGHEDDDGCPDPDNDGDGVLDASDECPDESEDIDGFQDGDGCPDPDNDGDGIPDARDECPDRAEDLDGMQDGDGCPEELTDRDGDGVADRDDACPERPEDVDGFEDDDGCPEADNDLDGLPDSRDACPNEAEDYDGVADDDGCPE